MQPPTFEETYPRHEFSELIRLTVACAGLLRRRLDRNAAIRLAPAKLPPVTAPAE